MVNEMDDTKDTFDMCMAGFIPSNTLKRKRSCNPRRALWTIMDTPLKVTETYDVYKGRGRHARGRPRRELVIVSEDQHVSTEQWFGLPASFVKELEKGFPVPF